MIRIHHSRTFETVHALFVLAFVVAGTSEGGAGSGGLRVITPAELNKEAASVPPAIASVYRFLAAPADRVVLADGKELWVAPLPQFLGARPAFAGTLDLTVTTGEETGKKRQVAATDLTAVTPFEQIALVKIQAFLDKETGLSALVKLQAAEKALQALAWFHDGSRSPPPVGPSAWQELRERVFQQLRKVRVDQLGVLAAAAKKDGTWPDAASLADQLALLYAGDRVMGRQLRQFWTEYGLVKIGQTDFARARKLLTRMETSYVRSPEAQPLREKLKTRAQELLEAAKTLSGREAEEKLSEALSLWPRLPAARTALRQHRGKNAVLYVGVRRLPERLSPATAWTDTEKQALELLFEGLVQPGYRAGLGQRYRAVLAETVPAPEPLLRRLQLRRDAYWSDGERVTSADVRHSVQLLLDTQPAWRDVLQVPRVEQESFAVTIPFSQGYFDPLALLSFKVLPQNYRGKTLLHADDPDFAQAPVGTGPYRFSGVTNENGRPVAVFSTNPEYTRSPQPPIDEIRMFSWSSEPLTTHHSPLTTPLLVDIPTEQLPMIKKRGLGHVHTVLERRVYFLAVNHRLTVLGNADLRRALAHALDRDKILDDCFRGNMPDVNVLEAVAPALASPLLNRVEKHPELHHALNGLYPVDSWALCPPPRVPASLYDAGRAKALFRAVQKSRKGEPDLKLTLKYPDDDPRVAAACRAISRQVEQLARDAGVKVQVQPRALSPYDLKRAVDRHDYELAYYHLDYDGEDYCLWPLFDPHPDALRPGGTNFLGYENDAKLQSLFRAALSQRSFSAVRDITHGIHAHLTLHMPLIPLWQLHRHILVPRQLDPGEVEPLRVFRRVAEWKIIGP